MDHDRFDRLAAAFAAYPSRRSILRIFSGGSLLAILGESGIDDVVAKKKGRKKKRKCKGTTKRCGRRCIPKTNCCTPADCDDGLICRDGACVACVSAEDCSLPPPCRQAVCQDGQCRTTPLPIGAPCEGGPSCLVNPTCNEVGECKGGSPDDDACVSVNPCRSGRCDPADPASDENGCVFDRLNGGTTICGVGACQRSVQRCIDGEEQPCVEGQPSPETCNGIDDDCDGVIDDGDLCPVDPPETCSNNGVCANGTCQKYGSATVCRPASCVGSTLQLQARCDGNGGCPPLQTQSCAPYMCHSNGMNCIGPGGCGGNQDCFPDHFCSGGVCRPKKENGEPCSFTFECASNFCDLGTCRPKRANGEPCSGPEQCASNICVVNVCCETFCQFGQLCTGGTCQA